MTDQSPQPKNKFNRRQFLKVSWFGSLVAMFGQTLSGIFSYIKPNLENGFGGMLLAGKVEEFAPGTVNHIQEGRFFLVRYDDGGFIAFWHRCTHLGCTVPYVEEEKAFHCPCHGSIYDLYGEVIGGPAPRPMDTFPIEIQNGEVYIDTGNPTVRTDFNPDQTVKG